MQLVHLPLTIVGTGGQRGGILKYTRRKTDSGPGLDTSCDYILSYQPILIPQLSGIPTHTTFWGSVLFADQFLDFLFNHLITGANILATLEANQAYERVANSYGVKV